MEATNALKTSGLTAAMSATGGEAKVDGLTLKLSGQTNAELAGAIAKVTAQGSLSLESTGIAKLQGSMTTVGGSLVKLG